MDPKSVVDILDRFLIEGLDKRIFLAIQPHILKFEGEQVKLSPAVRIGMVTKGGITVSEYVNLLDNNQYSAVFNDGSIFYVECIFSGRTLNRHRYFFIPCPFVEKTIAAKPKHVSLADWLRDSVDRDGKDVFSSKGTFRFDFVRESLQEAEEPHPLSHLTFASDTCRMPVRGPLQISSFIKFLFENFFRDDRLFWFEFSKIMRLDEGEVTITKNETYLHHLNWEIPSKVSGSVGF